MADRNPQVMTKEFLAERDLRIFKQRQAGVPITDIAKRFGVTTSVVNRVIQRQLEKLNREAFLAFPEVLRMELERLDSLQAAIWPLTQHRKITLDDGSEVTVQVLSIMTARSKLLGLEQNNVNIQMDVNTKQEITASLAGASEKLSADAFNPEVEARALLELMGTTGVLPADVVTGILGIPLAQSSPQPILAELVSGEEADDNE